MFWCCGYCCFRSLLSAIIFIFFSCWELQSEEKNSCKNVFDKSQVLYSKKKHKFNWWSISCGSETRKYFHQIKETSHRKNKKALNSFVSIITWGTLNHQSLLVDSSLHPTYKLPFLKLTNGIRITFVDSNKNLEKKNYKGICLRPIQSFRFIL